jgi:hypothetical protein
MMAKVSHFLHSTGYRKIRVTMMESSDLPFTSRATTAVKDRQIKIENRLVSTLDIFERKRRSVRA